MQDSTQPSRTDQSQRQETMDSSDIADNPEQNAAIRTTRSGRIVVPRSDIVPVDPSVFRGRASTSKSKKQPQHLPQARRCRICTAQFETTRNKFVRCTGCNEFYHQLCHVPRVVDESTETFFCSACDRQMAEEHPLYSFKHESLISGEHFSSEDKKEYLKRLPRHVLVEILLGLDASGEDVKMFPPDLKAVIEQEKEREKKRLESNAKMALDKLAKLRAVVGKRKKDRAAIVQRPTLAPAPTTTLPGYEEMIVEALKAINDPNGSPPRMIFEWMNDVYPLQKNFKASASQTLTKALKRGRLVKTGTSYKLNPDWDHSIGTVQGYKKPEAVGDHPANFVPQKSLVKPVEYYTTPPIASTSTTPYPSVPQPTYAGAMDLPSHDGGLSTITGEGFGGPQLDEHQLQAIDQAIESILSNHPNLRFEYHNQDFIPMELSDEDISQGLAVIDELMQIDGTILNQPPAYG